MSAAGGELAAKVLTYVDRRRSLQAECRGPRHYRMDRSMAARRGRSRPPAPAPNVHWRSPLCSPRPARSWWGGQVVIDAAVGTTAVRQSSTQKSAGINVGLTGIVVDAALTAYGASKAAGNVQDDRLKALYAVQAANAAVTTAAAVQQGAAGASTSTSQTSYDQSAVGSTIRSEGDVSIVATAVDLNIIGSQVKGDSVALAARDNIHLRSQAEDHTQSSKNESGSGEVGFSVGAQTGW